MSALATAPAEQRTQADRAAAVAQLYMQKTPRAEIAQALDVSRAQVDKLLSELFAEGMPQLMRRSMTDAQVRAIHTAYLRGGSIDELAAAIGFHGSAVRRQMRKKKLPLRRELAAGKTPAHAEQQLITALLMARVHELRQARGLTVEQLAHESDLTMSTLQYLDGTLRDPRLSTVLRLCRGLGTTAAELAGDLPLPVERRPRLARAGASG